MSKRRNVVISAAARLHLGFLDLNGSLGRRFGSIGLSIDGPFTRIGLRRAAVARAQGPDSERANAHLATLCRHFGVRTSYALTVHEAIPSHTGLGSGTALALAVAAAFRRLERLRADPRHDVRMLARGERSGVGIAVFRKGGFVVDAGHGAQTREPPILVRLPFPPNWRILLVQDSARRGIHGDEERAAFAALGPFGEAEADRICRLVLMQLLPGLVERRIGPFGHAVRAIQERLGSYFAPAQGGERFTSPEVAAALGALERAGAHGVGQSSWGPTGFAFAETQAEAERLRDTMRRDAASSNLDISIRRALNSGADIAIEGSSARPPRARPA
jgi:beta-ribofuranosylaminobenzene 5'-phosphate synthase